MIAPGSVKSANRRSWLNLSRKSACYWFEIFYCGIQYLLTRTPVSVSEKKDIGARITAAKMIRCKLLPDFGIM